MIAVTIISNVGLRLLPCESRGGIETRFRRLTPPVSIHAVPVRPIRDHPEQEDAMKYMLLIHQGTTPTPRDPEAWARLSEDEQKRVYADYQAVSQTPGVSPGGQM